MVRKASTICLVVSGLSLGLSAAFKLISALGTARILAEPDPLFGITNQQLFLLAGLLEASVAAVILANRNLRLRLILLAALSANLLLYRLGVWWLGAPQPCPCLGNAAAWTHADPGTLQFVTKASLVWLIASSYGPLLLLTRLRNGRPPQTANPYRVSKILTSSFLPLILTGACSVVASAREYTVEGVLVHTDFLPSGDVSGRFDEKFKVWVSGENWLISESRDFHGKQLSRDTGFDGTNTYLLNRFPPEPAPQGSQAKIFLVGSVNSLDVPPPDLVFRGSVIWLAYVSGGRLLRETTGKLRPVWMLNQPGLWQDGFKVSASWLLHPEEPYLPEFITFLDEGASAKSTSPGARFTNAIYGATFTNAGGTSVPASFGLTLLDTGIRGEILPVRIDEAATTSVRQGCELRSFRPELAGTAVISDCRLREPGFGYAARYVVTNGDWKVMPYNALIARWQKDKTAPKARSLSPIKQRIILLTMVVVSLGFAQLTLKTGQKEFAL
jgi:hypothetical protein